MSGRALAGALLVLGCKAEDLGVVLPEGGPTAISHEDLQRDAAMFSRGEPLAAWSRRLVDMHLHPGGPGGAVLPGSPPLACGRKDGAGPGAPLIVRAPAGCAAAAAAAISLAKGWDTPARPARGLWVCWGDGEPAALRERLGAAPGAPVLSLADAGQPGAWCAAGSGSEAVAGPCGALAGACGAPAGTDWRAVEASLEGLHAALGPVLEAGDVGPLAGWRSGPGD